jgi:putative endonuclease
MKMHENNAGLAAEKLAATFLTERGLKLVMQNFHCRFGEIDLVMTDGKTLVFIEVRLRSNARFGTAAMSITPQKQQKLILTAQFYCQQHAVQSPCRFDVVLMNKAEVNALEWIQNVIESA